MGWELLPLPGSLARCRPLEASLARLSERDPHRHVLGLAHWWTVACTLEAFATARLLVQAGGVVVKRLPITVVAVMVVPGVSHKAAASQQPQSFC